MYFILHLLMNHFRLRNDVSDPPVGKEQRCSVDIANPIPCAEQLQASSICYSEEPSVLSCASPIREGIVTQLSKEKHPS